MKQNKMKQIDYIMRSFERDEERINEERDNFCMLPVGLICEAFPEGEWHKMVFGGFEFRLPMNFAYIQIIKDFMKIQFPEWRLENERQIVWESKDAGYFLDYRIGSYREDNLLKFEFGLRTGVEGTTCVMNQIGTKEVPVYEVVCGEHAKDWSS